VNRQITILKEEHAAKCSALSNELSRLAKAKRQFERRKKTEKQKIDSDFEMKIQVQQVNLKSAIENIARLYDEDENDRGCQIIEAIRQVRETHNRTHDLLLQGRSELNAMKQSSDSSSADYRAAISHIGSGGNARDLLQRIERQKSVTEMQLLDLEARMNGVQESIGQTLAQQKSANQNIVLDIQSIISADQTKYETQCRIIQEEKSDVITHERMEIDRITHESEQKKERSVRNHSTDMQRHQQRIESAIKQRDEVAAQLTATAQHRVYRDEAKVRTNQMAPLGTEMIAHILSLSRSDVSGRNPPLREHRKMETLVSQIRSLDTMIQSSFEYAFSAIRDGPRDKQTPDNSLPIPDSGSCSSSRAPFASRSSRPKVSKRVPLVFSAQHM
jgi:hypothetical protein